MVMQEFVLQKVSLIILSLSVSLPGKARSAKWKKKIVLSSLQRVIQKVMEDRISCLF